jgi:hypothetical protein
MYPCESRTAIAFNKYKDNQSNSCRYYFLFFYNASDKQMPSDLSLIMITSLNEQTGNYNTNKIFTGLICKLSNLYIFAVQNQINPQRQLKIRDK